MTDAVIDAVHTSFLIPCTVLRSTYYIPILQLTEVQRGPTMLFPMTTGASESLCGLCGAEVQVGAGALWGLS